MAGFNNDTMFAQIGSDVGVFPNTSSSDNSTEFDRSGSTVSSIVNNVSDDALSDARMKARVNSDTSGVPYIGFTVGNTISWSIGINTQEFGGQFLSLNRQQSANVSPGTASGTERFRIGDSTAIFSLRLHIIEDDSQTTFVESIVRNLDTTNNAAAGVRNTLATTSNTADVYHLLNVPQDASPGDQTWEQGISSSNSGRVEWRSPINAALPGLAGTLRLAMTTAGELTLPTNPAFSGFLSATDSNVTGDGTTYTLGQGNVLTLLYNRGSDITTAGVFTASITGIYCFMGMIRMATITAAEGNGSVSLVTSNNTYTSNLFAPSKVFQPNNLVDFQINNYADMDAGDTAVITCRVSTGTLIVDASGGSTTACRFSGRLVG